ncbi:MAG: cytochrome c peroxidase, partial [Terriglobia bacterium]
MSGRLVALVVIVLVVIVGVVVWTFRLPPPAIPIGATVEIQPPLGLPPVPTPADNPPTAETIALGRKLYYDPLLSVDDTVACASCHHPDFGFSDGK